MRLGAAENADITQGVEGESARNAGSRDGINSGEAGRIQRAEAARKTGAEQEHERQAGIAVKMQFQAAVADTGDTHDGQHHRQHRRNGEQMPRRTVERRSKELADAGRGVAQRQHQADAVVGAHIMRTQEQQATASASQP